MTFAEIGELLEKQVRNLQVELLAPETAARELGDVDKIVKLAGAARMFLAPRAAESRAWARDGHLSPENWLAAESGTSVHEARDTLEAGEKLRRLEAVADAARSGELSAEQTKIIVDGAADNPGPRASWSTRRSAGRPSN